MIMLVVLVMVMVWWRTHNFVILDGITLYFSCWTQVFKAIDYCLVWYRCFPNYLLEVQPCNFLWCINYPNLIWKLVIASSVKFWPTIFCWITSGLLTLSKNLAPKIDNGLSFWQSIVSWAVVGKGAGWACGDATAGWAGCCVCDWGYKWLNIIYRWYEYCIWNWW